MKIVSFILVLFISNTLLSQKDTSSIIQKNKISKLLDKVHIISETNIEHKHQIINKSKIDSLMFRIDVLKTEQPKSTTKQDSLEIVINTLKNNLLKKDSLINELKTQLSKQLNTTSLQKNNDSKKIKNFIVLGAFRYKNNAQQKIIMLRSYNLEMMTVGNLYYVVYTLKPNEKIQPTLLKFRNKIETNAWIISI